MQFRAVLEQNRSQRRQPWPGRQDFALRKRATFKRFEQYSDRLLAAWSVAVVLAGANLWLLHSYYERGKDNGFSVYWTDGAGNLATVVAAQHLPVAISDWEIQSGLQVETRDQIPIVALEPIRPGVLYVGHCAGFVIDESRSVHYQQLLREERRVTDRQGAPLYCLYEMEKQP